MIYCILAFAIVCNATANILIKLGMMKLDAIKLAPFDFLRYLSYINLTIVAGIAMFALALVSYAYVLSKMNLSIAYPVMTSLGFVIVIAFSATFLKETITFIQLIGFASIILGVWLVAR
ncbi:MAG: EamA family transporter [Pseudomonadota bacterium]